jgi:hypothetical protein
MRDETRDRDVGFVAVLLEEQPLQHLRDPTASSGSNGEFSAR